MQRINILLQIFVWQAVSLLIVLPTERFWNKNSLNISIFSQHPGMRVERLEPPCIFTTMFWETKNNMIQCRMFFLERHTQTMRFKKHWTKTKHNTESFRTKNLLYTQRV